MSAQRLRDAQTWFLAAISHGEDVDQGIEAARKVTSDAPLENHVTKGPNLGARERLEIYHHAYRARLVECLADDYPAVQFALGEEAFESLCHAYIAQHPSRSFSLNAYGRHLESFCQSRSETWAPFARDMAALEWAIVTSIHARGPSGVLAEQLASLRPEDFEHLTLTPNETLVVVRSEYPVNQFFQAFRLGEEPAIPEPARTATAVYRKGMSIWRRDLTNAMVGVLAALVAGEPLGTALAAADATEEEVGAWFGEWMADGFFASAELKKPLIADGFSATARAPLVRLSVPMHTEPTPCTNCGAMMAAEAADPRVLHCHFCNTRVQAGVSGDQLAHGMQLDLANIDNFLAHLANTLSQGFAEHTRIKANGRVVHAIEIDLAPDQFAVTRDGAQATATHKKIVRGIALKTQTLALDRWVTLLFDALARHSNASQQAAWVLGQLGGKR